MGTDSPRRLLNMWYARLRTGRIVLPPRTWLVVAVGGIVLGISAGVIGDERGLRPITTVVGLAAGAAILVGIRTHRPARPLPWRLMAGCVVLATIGGSLVPMAGWLGVAGSIIDGIGNLMGIAGFILLLRGRIPGGDRAAILDAAILASGLAVVIWAVGFAPLLAARGENAPFAGALVYPAVIALAMIGRLWFMGGPHQPGTRLIILFVVTSNVVTVLDAARSLVPGDLVGGAHIAAVLLTLAFLSAAALHPAMALVPERHHADLRPIGRGRLLGLAGALLVNPASLAMELWMGSQVDAAPYVIGGVLVGSLVVFRLGDALRQLSASLEERESLTELLRRQSLYDALTSLPNRNLFNQRIATDFAGRANDLPMAVILVDIDDFKSVNDRYGHEAGDDLLVAVGQRLQASIRAGDLAARLGGDEFVITLPTCADPVVPIQVAERILAALGRPYDIGGHSVSVLASVGVALADTADATSDEVVRKADVAMYLAKSRGKGRVEVFEPSMDSAAEHQVLRTDLSAGIASGDLRIGFEPVIDLRTGRTVGHEAILRWLRKGQLLQPAEFMSVAESSGLIRSVTDWALNEACRTTALRLGRDDRSWVNVNLPASQLTVLDVDARVSAILTATGLAPDRLVLSITETSLLNVETARPAIERLSGLGARIAVDDFGTGYSALSYLAHLPIDMIKIDRSFVAALHHSGPDEAIASAIIAVAGRLGMTTIAAGIETAAQLELLAGLGCDFGQGEYLARANFGERGVRTRSRSRALSARPGLIGVRT